MARTVLVTGGTRGIGAAIARHCQDQGYRVAASYAGNDAAAQRFAGESGIYVRRWDAGLFTPCQEGVAAVEAELGPVDILVNNAGITLDKMFHRMSEEEWDRVIATNLKSCFNMTRAVIEGMRLRGFGRIINIGSVNGQKGQIGQVNYAATKAALIGFTRALALENAAKGITVNIVAPGYINTDMVAAVAPEILRGIIAQIPVGRLGEAREIASLVGFLARDDSGFITGATLPINGGQYMG